MQRGPMSIAVILHVHYVLIDVGRVIRAICDAAADADLLAEAHPGWAVRQVGASTAVHVGGLLPARRRCVRDAYFVPDDDG